MDSALNLEISRQRSAELIAAAARRRPPTDARALRDAAAEPWLHDVSIRLAREADADALNRLAQLDGARELAGDVLVAEIDGRVLAALTLDGRRRVADPFRPTGPLVELLKLRLAQLRGEVPGRAQRLRSLASWRPRRRPSIASI